MTTCHRPFPLVLRPMDIEKLRRYELCQCRKCQTDFKDGETVIRTGRRPPKYFHENCFKQY